MGPVHDNLVSASVVLAAGMWVVAGTLAAATWLLAAVEAPLRFEIATATLAVLSAMVAVVLHVRSYTMRLCGLVRACSGLQRPGLDLHVVDHQ